MSASGIEAVEKATECKLKELQKIFTSLKIVNFNYQSAFTALGQYAETLREINCTQSNILHYWTCTGGAKLNEDGWPVADQIQEIDWKLIQANAWKERFERMVATSAENSSRLLSQAEEILKEHTFCDPMVHQSIAGVLDEDRKEKESSDSPQASFVPSKFYEDSVNETTKFGRPDKKKQSKNSQSKMTKKK